MTCTTCGHEDCGWATILPIEWTAWQCDDHDVWFGMGDFHGDIARCVEQDCRVLVFDSPRSADGVNVKFLLFSGHYKWIEKWPPDPEPTKTERRTANVSDEDRRRIDAKVDAQIERLP